MERLVRIGAASAFFVDSRTAMPQLLKKGGRLDYIVFDLLAEATMANLGRAASGGREPGFSADFVDGSILPHLAELLDRGIRVVANAGGLDPAGCAERLRAKAEALGLKPRIGVVAGDDLRGREAEFVTAETREMFDGSSVAERLVSADKVVSFAAYTGAFPIAAALAAGADIVVTGRAVDSAVVLGPLIHAFGWGVDDFDKLAAGALAGHLIECSAQVTGGTFTDWRDVPDWAGMGFPIAECRADGGVVITKPEGTGGLVSVGTVAEQLLYEVSDPQRYVLPDVVCDFTGVTLQEVGPDRVEVSGARGLGRTATYKASLAYDQGWRCTALIPLIGLEAGAKARRVGEELFARTRTMLRDAQLPDWTATHCEVIGGEGPGPSQAICRMVADHPDVAGVQMLAREQSSVISHMSVGITIPLGVQVRPVQRIAGLLIPKTAVSLTVAVDGAPVAYTPRDDGDARHLQVPAPPLPPSPEGAEPDCTVPLIRLAWARSGDKGDLFNVGVIARRPEYLPFIAAALTPEAVGERYGRLVGKGQPLPVDRYSAPGFSALNFVVRQSLDGGIMASQRLDPAAKGMAQLLLDFPVSVSRTLKATLDEFGLGAGAGSVKSGRVGAAIPRLGDSVSCIQMRAVERAEQAAAGRRRP